MDRETDMLEQSRSECSEDEFPDLDLFDSYFFDHPLDHLPGTYLVSETLAIASRRSGRNILDFSSCEFAWHAFAELDQNVWCRARVSDHSFEGKLFQSKQLSTFRINWRLEDVEPLDGGELPSQIAKPKPIFAHKQLKENVLVSTCHWNADKKLQCFAFAPGEGHKLEWSSDHVHPLFLLESCKQLLTVAAQTFFSGFAKEGPQSKYQMILKRFSLELHRPIATTAKIHLQVDGWNLKKWRRNVPKAADFVVTVNVGNQVAGTLSLESLIVEPDFFEYLRSQTS